jgi:hypothetical protein
MYVYAGIKLWVSEDETQHVLNRSTSDGPLCVHYKY